MSLLLLSNNVKYSDNTGQGSSSATYVLAKTITMNSNYGGSWRIKFDIFVFSGGGTVYGKIYKNGVAYGTEQSTTSGFPVTKTEDFNNIDIRSGDTIQLYIHGSGANTVSCSNFQILFDIEGKNLGDMFLMF